MNRSILLATALLQAPWGMLLAQEQPAPATAAAPAEEQSALDEEAKKYFLEEIKTTLDPQAQYVAPGILDVFQSGKGYFTDEHGQKVGPDYKGEIAGYCSDLSCTGGGSATREFLDKLTKESAAQGKSWQQVLSERAKQASSSPQTPKQDPDTAAAYQLLDQMAARDAGLLADDPSLPLANADPKGDFCSKSPFTPPCSPPQKSFAAQAQEFAKKSPEEIVGDLESKIRAKYAKVPPSSAQSKPPDSDKASGDEFTLLSMKGSSLEGTEIDPTRTSDQDYTAKLARSYAELLTSPAGTISEPPSRDATVLGAKDRMNASLSSPGGSGAMDQAVRLLNAFKRSVGIADDESALAQPDAVLQGKNASLRKACVREKRTLMQTFGVFSNDDDC
ncbi:MAG: hypothetical protein WCU88_04590 [Elusimicrobiota bacterium]|jgi:hypothetical protein